MHELLLYSPGLNKSHQQTSHRYFFSCFNIAAIFYSSFNMCCNQSHAFIGIHINKWLCKFIGVGFQAMC